MLGYTASSWLNAWSLRRGCAALGVDLRVPAGPRQLPLPSLPDLPGAAPPQWLFFTEEASLRQALQGEDARARNARYWPRQFPLTLLDDKWAFAQWLAADDAGPPGLPQWALAQAAQARYPLLLKSRHSWAGGRKLPRGWVCHDAAELAQRRHDLVQQGLAEDNFFLQAWLGDAPLRLLSVGGFFDAQNEARNLAVLTERVADYGAGPSSSAMLVTVPDALGLVAQAGRVLRRLQYHGPYELEFIAVAGRAMALELNPRFWMQHGLFGAAGNGLLKRYLGLDTAADHALPPPQRLLWVDGSWLLRRLARADGRALALLGRWWLGRRYRLVLCPTPGFMLRAALWRVLGGGARAR